MRRSTLATASLASSRGANTRGEANRRIFQRYSGTSASATGSVITKSLALLPTNVTPIG